MAWMVVVKVRGTKEDDIYSPNEMSEEEADRQLAAIRNVLGSDHIPDVPWLAVVGKDIVSAHKIEFEHRPEPRRSVGVVWALVPNLTQPLRRKRLSSGNRKPAPRAGFFEVGRTGLEPVTSGLSSRRSPS